MPRFDFKCPSCGAIRQDVWVSTYRAENNHPVAIAPCGLCNVPLEKMPAAPNFKVEGFNERNGYGSR